MLVSQTLEREGRLGLAGHSIHIQLILQMILISFNNITKEIPLQLLIFPPFSQLSGQMRLNLSSDGAFDLCFSRLCSKPMFFTPRLCRAFPKLLVTIQTSPSLRAAATAGSGTLKDVNGLNL